MGRIDEEEQFGRTGNAQTLAQGLQFCLCTSAATYEVGVAPSSVHDSTHPRAGFGGLGDEVGHVFVEDGVVCLHAGDAGL